MKKHLYRFAAVNVLVWEFVLIFNSMDAALTAAWG